MSAATSAVARTGARITIVAILVVGVLSGIGAEPVAAEPEPPVPTQRIVAGTDVDPPGKYPFVVALVTPSDLQFCGGSLIAPTWVLTAAHCLTDPNGIPNLGVSDFDVIVGRHDLGSTDGERLDVASIVVHPNWLVPPNAANSDDDIALIELANAATAGGLIRPAGPADLALYSSGLAGTTIGWGSTNPSPPYNNSDTLREVDVPFVSDAACGSFWGAVVVAIEDLCAGSGPSGEDSCVGDSGGPLVAPVGTEPWTLIGIVSFGGRVCGAPGVPAVYTEVAAYRDWILDTAELDTRAPSVVVEQAAGQADPTGDAPVMFSVTFSEEVLGFGADDVTLGGTARPQTALVTPAGPLTYDVAVSAMTGSGTVTAHIASGAVTDIAGNANTTSTSVDNEVTFQTSAPSVTVEQAAGQHDPTNVGTVDFTVTFSAAVVGFEAGDITLGGTAGATTAVVTPAGAGGAAFGVTVSGMSTSGTVTATVGAGVAADLAGNENTASSSVDNEVTYDVSAPVIDTPGTVTSDAETGRNGAVVDYTVTATDGGVTTGLVQQRAADGALVPAGGLVCAPRSGSFFFIGTTLVTCTATDDIGNVATATLAVVVIDRELPTIGDPGPQFASISAPPLGPLTYTPPDATDNSGAFGISCDPPPGALVGIGTTRVTCTATDPSGNAVSVVFEVVVTAPVLPATGRDLGLLPVGVAALIAGFLLLAISRAGARRSRRFT